VIIIFTITNGVKAGFLFLSIIWASGYVSAYIYENKGQIRNVRNLFSRIVIILVLVFCLVPVTQFFREGKSNEKIKFISPGIISYFVSFNAFTIWYHSYQNDELTCFKYTLSGAHNYFYGEREQGLYGKDYTSVGNFNDQPITTNIYTMARGMIEDFTIFGAILLLFITGMLVHLLYLLTMRKRIIAMSLLALFFSILFCSFTQNIINYNTIFFSWIISFLIILLMKKKRSLTHHQAKEE
jgi:oligosaccharide repeat unit polymerase